MVERAEAAAFARVSVKFSGGSETEDFAWPVLTFSGATPNSAS